MNLTRLFLVYLKVLSWDLFFSIVSLNDFYYFIENAKVHNFADDNTLTTFAQIVRNLISVLESESNIAIDWFKANKMIVNPGKFQSIIIDKRNKITQKKLSRLGIKLLKLHLQ